MNWDLDEEVAEILSKAASEPLVPREVRERPPILDRAGVEAILPYRDPFLLVDRVTWLDLDAGLIVARYDLARAAAVFAGHFPRYPVWPGVLQVEAIGQTGGLLYAIQTHERDRASFALTRIAGARFSRPVTPPGDVEIVARVLDEGLLVNVIGQCLQDGAICSAAAVTFL